MIVKNEEKFLRRCLDCVVNLMDEIIIVDDIVREIPNAKPSDTPPVTYLAMRIKRGLENRRLEFEDFVYRVFVSKSDTNDLAEAN